MANEIREPKFTIVNGSVVQLDKPENAAKYRAEFLEKTSQYKKLRNEVMMSEINERKARELPVSNDIASGKAFN